MLSAQAGTVFSFDDANGNGATETTANTATVAGSWVDDASGNFNTTTFTISDVDIDGDMLNDTFVVNVVLTRISAANAAFDSANNRYNPNLNGAGKALNVSLGAVTATTLTDGGTLQVDSFSFDLLDMALWNGTPDDTATIAQDGGSAVAYTDASSAIALSAANSFELTNTAGAFRLANFDFTIEVSAIPEPSTYALLGGLFALSFVMVRRRK
ncbi:Unannotated [Lentimonas sp. CC4]|nr:Unannotated [Lentimonas sp. CC4]